MKKLITLAMTTCLFVPNLLVFAEDVSQAEIPPSAPNGIPFPKGYQNWQILASSYRKDNETLRIILGNDIAIKAAQAGKTTPWPDKAILGKVVWKTRVDDNWQTALVPGQFVHAEFMFKDTQRLKVGVGRGG